MAAPPPPTCCDFLFRVLFGFEYQRVPTQDSGRATVALDLVRQDGTVETVRTDLATFIRHLKQKDLKESREQKEWLSGRIVRQVKIPQSAWDRLKSSRKHSSLYPRVRHAMEGYKRNKLALHQLLAIMDSIQGDEEFHEQVLPLLPWEDFIEMARTSRKVESDGANALHWVLSWRGESLTEEKIQEILQVQPALARQTANSGSLPIHLAAYFHSKSPNNPVLKRVIQAYPQGLEQINECGMNSLHYALAAKQPHLETIRVIVEAYPAAVAVKDRVGRNALHWALQGENDNVRPLVEYLLEHGSARDLLKGRTKEMGATPLQVSVLYHPANIELTQLLLTSWAEGAKEITRNGLTVLHFAVLTKRATLENVRLVHEAWPDALRFRDSKGMTPLHLAIRAGAPMDVISFLFDASSESVYEEQVCQESLLHFILFHPDVNVEITRRVYQAYPAAIREANAEGFMPLHVALYHGANEDVVKFLLEKWQGSVRVTTANGFTALHCAVHMASDRKKNGQDGDGNQGEDGSSPTEAQALLGDDLAVNKDDDNEFKDEDIIRPRAVNINVVKLIHRRWPDALKAPAAQLRVTPFVDALISGASLEVVKYLYEEWPECLTLRNQPIPPLHAAMTGRAPANVVDFLIETNPKSVWECSAPLGGTPLHVGVRNGAPLECINLLLDKCGPARAARMKIGGDLLIHCALKARADVEIIERLVQALPGCLLERDGEGIYPRDYALLYPANIQPRLKQLLTVRTNQARRGF